MIKKKYGFLQKDKKEFNLNVCCLNLYLFTICARLVLFLYINMYCCFCYVFNKNKARIPENVRG